MVRVFYVVYFGDPRLQKALDSVRLICSPQEKCQAHITVRGPYKQQHSFPDLARKLARARIEVKGVGRFFTRTQSTVLIRCDSPALRSAWNKPDFGYVPHITVYDGRDREFAAALWHRIQQLDLRFWFRPTPLVALLSQKGATSAGSLDLRQLFDSRFVEGITGVDVAADELDALTVTKRLDLVYALLARVPEFGTARLKRKCVPPSEPDERGHSTRSSVGTNPHNCFVPLLARHS